MEDIQLSHSAFAHRLQMCVERAGTLVQLAKSAGLHRNTFGKYLRGTEPPRHNLIKIARAAGVSVNWLMTGENPVDGPTPGQQAVEGKMPSLLIAAIKEVADSVGGIEIMADLTEISERRLQAIFAGDEMSVSELTLISSRTRTPVSWLLCNKGFDQLDRSVAVSGLERLLSRIEVIEEKRSGKLQRFGLMPGAWNKAHLSAIFSLWEQIFEKLPPKKYQSFEIQDNLMVPTLELSDIAVVEMESESSKPGIYLFERNGERFFARGLPAAGQISFTFDNPNYRTPPHLAAIIDRETACIGKVVAVFGPPH